MPADFERCVRNGGKVRTKSLGGNRYMRICILGGKTYAGEVKTKESEGVKMDKDITEKVDLFFTSPLLEKKVDENSRTVVAGILQEDTLSSNNRFYPAHVVRKATESLVGKRSLIGHDTDSAEDVVAKITEAGISNRVAYATFKFGTDPRSEMIFSKIREGLIDSTSIRASGQTRRAKINGELVDVVEKMDIYSVDWVVEGGVKAAKVVKVFESAPEIKYGEQQSEEEKMELKEMEKALEEANAKIKELQGTVKEKDKEVKDHEYRIAEAKLEAHRAERLATIKDEEVRLMMKEQLGGKTNEEIDKQFEAMVKYYESLRKKAGAEDEGVRIRASEDGEDLKFRTGNEFLESKDVPEENKRKYLKELLG